MKEERNHLLKVHVTHSGGTWTLKPKANKGGGLEHKQDIIFKGDDEQFRKFLIKLGAKDVETSPASVRNHSYIQMVDDIKTGKDREIWVWTKTWNSYKSNKVVMGMRTTEDKAITVKEAFRIPGTDYIVEDGEKIEVFESSRMKGPFTFEVGGITWHKVRFNGWEPYTAYISKVSSDRFLLVKSEYDDWSIEKVFNRNKPVEYHVNNFMGSTGYNDLVAWLKRGEPIAGKVLEPESAYVDMGKLRVGGRLTTEGENFDVVRRRVTESDAKAQINILMKGIKDVEDAVREFFHNRESGDFSDILNQELPKGWEVYPDSGSRGLPIVMNVKGRGFPDYDKVIEALAKKSKMDKDMVELRIDERFFSDLHQDILSFSMKDVEEETGMPLLITGRSGGYWGFNLVDYHATRGYDVLVLKDSKKFVEKYGADIVSLWLDKGYVFEPRDIRNAIELFFDAISYNSPFRYASGNILEDEATLSPTFKKTLTEFQRAVDSIASELESTDYWVDLIMANDYLEEGVRRKIKPMRRVTESKDPLGVRKLKEGNHEIQFKFWPDGISKPLRSPSLEWLVDMIEIEFLPRDMKELLRQRPQVQVVIDGQILKSGLPLAEIFQAMGKRY